MESRITFGSSAEPRKGCELWDRALAPTGFIILSKRWYTNCSYSHKTVERIKCVCFSHVWFFCDPRGLWPTRLLCLWDSPGRNTGVGCHFLLQGIFLTQGSNPPLLYWQADSLVLSYQESSEVENRLKQEIKYFISTKQKTLVRTCICYLDYLLQPNQPKSSNLKQQWLFIP